MKASLKSSRYIASDSPSYGIEALPCRRLTCSVLGDLAFECQVFNGIQFLVILASSGRQHKYHGNQ